MSTEKVLGLDLARTELPDAIAAMVEAWLEAQGIDVKPQLPAHAINCAEAARVIRAKTGRSCTRQSMEKLCQKGALQGSPCILQAKPLRLDPDLLVIEYLAKVGQWHRAQQPTDLDRDRLP